MVIRKQVKHFLSVLLINPVFTAALICSILFYTDTVPLKDRQQFVCLFNLNTICSLEGTLSSSPVRSSNNPEVYTAVFNVRSVKTLSGAKGSATGIVKVLLAGRDVEALLPGKLYSRSSAVNPVIFESGTPLILEVSLLDEEGLLFKALEFKSFKEPDSIKHRFLRFRSLCRLQFKRLMYGWGEAGGLLLALLTGSREYTDQSVSLAFRNAGLSHILALSGMHLSLFGGLAFFIGNRLTKRNMADLLELCAILFFVWFAGPGPSLIRALISSLITFINSSLRMRRFKGLTVLSATFLIHLMIFPVHLKSAAFMLSYGALAGIMTVGQLLNSIISKRLIPKLSGSLSESAGAQIFTAPVTISLFSKLMPIGIISSVIVSPVVIIFLYTGLAGTVLCLCMPFLEGPFNDIMNCIYLLIKKIVFVFSSVPPLDFSGTN